MFVVSSKVGRSGCTHVQSRIHARTSNRTTPMNTHVAHSAIDKLVCYPVRGELSTGWVGWIITIPEYSPEPQRESVLPVGIIVHTFTKHKLLLSSNFAYLPPSLTQTASQRCTQTRKVNWKNSEYLPLPSTQFIHNYIAVWCGCDAKAKFT